MNTKLLSAEDLRLAAQLLRQGEIVAFPTETVYGLGAHIFSVDGIQKIFRAKERPCDNPLIAHVASIKDIEKIAVDIPAQFYQIAEVFFPGPLTVLLKRSSKVPPIVSGGLPTLAVRCPSHRIARELIEETGDPLVAPSANRSGRPSATSAQHVLDDLGGRIAAVIDGGMSALGIESTVLSLEGEHPRILRPGNITAMQIEDVLKQHVSYSMAKMKEHTPSPGMRYRHYAPRIPLKLFYSKEELETYLSSAVKPLVLVRHGSSPLTHLHEYNFFSAKELYAILRFAECRDFAEIVVFCDEIIRQDLALMDRLLRASGNL